MVKPLILTNRTVFTRLSKWISFQIGYLFCIEMKQLYDQRTETVKWKEHTGPILSQLECGASNAFRFSTYDFNRIPPKSTEPHVIQQFTCTYWCMSLYLLRLLKYKANFRCTFSGTFNLGMSWWQHLTSSGQKSFVVFITIMIKLRKCDKHLAFRMLYFDEMRWLYNTIDMRIFCYKKGKLILEYFYLVQMRRLLFVKETHCNEITVGQI